VRPAVQRKTPPKATSSPKTQAVSSVSRMTWRASLMALHRLSGRAGVVVVVVADSGERVVAAEA